MDLGLVTAVATGVGVHLVYHEKGRAAAVAAVATGVALYLAYYLKLRANPKLASVFNGKNNTASVKNIGNWTPLTTQEIENIRNIVNNSPIKIVSEP